MPTRALTPPVDITGGVPWPLPWIGHRRRNWLRDAAHPSLLAALRRLAAIPRKPTGFGDKGGLDFTGDLAVMDTGRATVNRVKHAATWNALHPPTPRAYMYNLRHAGYVIRAVGLTPSYTYKVYEALNMTDHTHDVDLLTGAHLAGISDFSGYLMRSLLTQHYWSVWDLINWCTTYNADHYADCLDVGFTADELGGLIRSRNIPDAAQVEMLKAFQMSPPASA